MSNQILLHDFYVSKLQHITEQWYDSLNRVNNGVYSSTSTEDVERLKRQAMSFHEQFFKVFITDEQTFRADMDNWIREISFDEAHLNTLNSAKIYEFLQTQQQYTELLDEYVESHPDFLKEAPHYRQVILQTMQEVILKVTNEFEKNQETLFREQREMITELSAPIILLSPTLGLLPLVGEIDTYRARVIINNVLASCNEKGVERLVVDLSGVSNVDTAVAKQLLMLIKSLSIIGVESCLSGIRPEIAQTTIKLGIKLDGINVYSSIQQALKDK
ncbi:STAS domain-containing protein [Alkalicoccobacillus gibsonii]|uniref:STAS domain-containing protein n=1 Tax=Alkalicoccobacillus gibsonii TaxID=79881 RepID=UPI0019340305|nr:STAS domain-containing protein [Alkalicoccobacillus gibsonii]MBM0066329.1 STAS domain-containing protein [Alkalicoccobacillus gibsonii]